MSVLFVGEDNPYGSDPEYALFCEPSNSAGGRLCRLICGLRRPTYLALRRVNLCAESWSKREAEKKAAELKGLAEIGVYVLLGRKVASAFGVGYMRPFHIEKHVIRATLSEDVTLPQPGPFAYVVLPHPSGRCQAWNEPGAYELARNLLKMAAPSVPWGEADR